MKTVYFTVTGTNYRFGQDFFEKDMPVRLVKEPDNAFDSEAIKVEMDGLGLVGYVANSPETVKGESSSAGRIYDKIGEKASGRVLYVLKYGVICTLDEKSIITGEYDEDERIVF